MDNLLKYSLSKDPHNSFMNWYSDAKSVEQNPDAMTLSTVDVKNNRPDSRTVLFKGMSDHSLKFYTNYNSKKGQDLIENPQASLVFFWAELERQVRIDGLVTKVDAATSDAYFHSRPIGSQIGATASPQSSILDSRSSLEEKVAELTKTFEGQEIPRPEHWGGYLIEPTHIEFWQGRPSRLHDRLSYDLIDGSWIINRLAP